MRSVLVPVSEMPYTFNGEANPYYHLERFRRIAFLDEEVQNASEVDSNEKDENPKPGEGFIKV